MCLFYHQPPKTVWGKIASDDADCSHNSEDVIGESLKQNYNFYSVAPAGCGAYDDPTEQMMMTNDAWDCSTASPGAAAWKQGYSGML